MQASIRSAQFILPASPFDETLAFFTNRLGFQLDIIFPADDPAIAVISGYGLNLRLERNQNEMAQSAGTIRLVLNNDSELFQNDTTEMLAPNGTKIEIVKETTKLHIPPIEQSFVLRKMATDATWIVGRAGMNYRDLIPGRLGGRFIASHIRIPTGGPVADHVHYHEIRFQMIYVVRGWVRLIYEDQGPSFVLQAGDCVLQPPLIRHRVLESSAGLEVIEVACPATHNTLIDHQMQLPSAEYRPDRDYGGQRFVKYLAANETLQWCPWISSGFEFRDSGISLATANLAGVCIVRNNGNPSTQLLRHDAEFVFRFILNGELTLHVTGHASEKMTSGDSFVVPEKILYNFTECSKDLQFLEVSLPGTINCVHE
ncbi:unnamed protein product [Rotaria magnacalcarata]|uniref:Cupin type-2 domain-containing protein n=1 Tax=Rotaria magnacalcarata TaxID=392030 RepID=A0A815RY70_9BILA|nr:unnamed protein product [Rotaria magnacalcarata]CAF2089677.1 unnamed protein product [Rotaria magnacalcarata]CAF4002839.1 unnamed protein product [Rotaria magnacalcarata]CAF4117253.1 unnamed protein product [Rotaria magnacalcarata]